MLGTATGAAVFAGATGATGIADGTVAAGTTVGPMPAVGTAQLARVKDRAVACRRR
jgi:hypothetical protein